MEPPDFLRFAVAQLETLGIEYFLTGSVASSSYGKPRFTNDFDIVVRLSPGTALQLARAFPDDTFYVSAEAAQDAASRGGQFNVIDFTSGFKIDFMVAADDPFNESRFARASARAIMSGPPMRMASPEDVILRKLQYYQEGGSERHLRDIRDIMSVRGDDSIWHTSKPGPTASAFVPSGAVSEDHDQRRPRHPQWAHSIAWSGI